MIDLNLSRISHRFYHPHIQIDFHYPSKRIVSRSDIYPQSIYRPLKTKNIFFFFLLFQIMIENKKL